MDCRRWSRLWGLSDQPQLIKIMLRLVVWGLEHWPLLLQVLQLLKNWSGSKVWASWSVVGFESFL
jgi:hypothetical protein